MSITYMDKGKWLHREISRQGHFIENLNGVWRSSDDIVVQSIIDSFDPIPGAKADKRNELKREAAKRSNSIYSFIDGGDDIQQPSDAIAFYNFAEDLLNTIKPAAQETLSGRLLSFKDVVGAAKAARAEINALSSLKAILSYDVVNTPSWP